ncbi:MAG: hypothetical protein KBC73_16505 [Burkholderiaceae bacterium]|nr:hypothetical protein [Burkholderiaceae bacterium]
MKADQDRNRLLRRAVLTSLSGKGISVATQLLAIPLAVVALGLDRYGAYAMLAAILMWVSNASTVVAGALTLQLVPAHADRDVEAEARLFSTAFYFALALAVAVVAVLAGALYLFDLGRIFGVSSIPLVRELGVASGLMLLLIPLNILFSLAEAAQAGYQRQYVTNALQIVANIGTLLMLLLVVRWTPSVPAMVLAMFGPLTLVRVVNFGMLMRGGRHLWPRWSHCSGPTLRDLMRMGAAFGLMQVGTFLFLQFPTFYVGREVGLHEAAYLTTMMLVINIFGSLLVIFTQPLTPALRDAMTRGNPDWVARAHRAMLRRVVPYVTLASVVIAVAGSMIVSLLTRQSVDLEVGMRWAWAAFFWIVAWEHLHYTFVVGVGRLWRATWLYLGGAALMLLVSLSSVPRFGITGAFVAMCLGPLCFTVIGYPLALRRTMRGHDGSTQHSHAP